MNKSIIGAIDGDKVFEWMYSNGYFSLRAADMLADEWEKGTFRLDDQGEATRLREALSKIIDVLTDDTSINAQRINNIIIEAFSSSHREDGWIPADKTPAAGQYLVSDGNQVSFGWWMEGSDDRRWYAADAAPFLSEDITHYRPIPVPPISIITVER